MKSWLKFYWSRGPVLQWKIPLAIRLWSWHRDADTWNWQCYFNSKNLWWPELNNNSNKSIKWEDRLINSFHSKINKHRLIQWVWRHSSNLRVALATLMERELSRVEIPLILAQIAWEEQGKFHPHNTMMFEPGLKNEWLKRDWACKHFVNTCNLIYRIKFTDRDEFQGQATPTKSMWLEII